MAKKHTVEQLKIRKHVLQERTDKENENIIKKIDRKISRLVKEIKRQGISKSILL